MRLVARGAACRRGLAWLVAVVLCLGPALAGVGAQDAAGGGPASIASGGESVLLRDQPGYEAASLAELSDGSALEVTGDVVMAADGTAWVPVVAAGQSGYVPAGYVGAASTAPAPPADAAAAPASSAAAPEPVVAAPAGVAATTTTDANLRTAPSTDADVVLVLPPGTPLSVTGELENGFVPVTANGSTGWVAVDLITEGSPPTAAPVAAPTDANTPFDATAMTDLDLRAAPDPSSAVLATVPAGSAMRTTGGPQNGYFPVEHAGQIGWVDGTALSIPGAETTAVTPPTVDVTTPAPAPLPDPVTATGETAPAEAERRARGESTGIVWPFAGGEWEVVQGYNNGTHTNRSGFAQYKYSLDWARVDGDTAGQPVSAPVSGTVRWTDRGSGGMLIDAGNGYGVAVFHVTIDRGLGRGDRVERGQSIGTISGPGGEGYMSIAHIDITAWRLTNNGHEAVPFEGLNAIAGMEFPDTGGTNQHMGARVTP
jgi:uncharacterized protein YraI